MRSVEGSTDGTVRLGPGTLYTTLARLEADGLIEESDDRPDPAIDDQRRRYWKLTASWDAPWPFRRSGGSAAVVERARPWALGEKS